ncbi:MAG: hypothetical protein U1G08_18175 [Verrucomicrobiota bacterium]
MTGPQQIRLVVQRTASASSAMVDANTSSTPVIFRGTDVEFWFAIFAGDLLESPSSLATVTLEVKGSDARIAAALMSKTISPSALNPGLTIEQWDAGEAAHGVIAFSSLETALDLLQSDSREFHLVLAGTTADSKKITLGISVLTIIEDGTPSGQLVPPAIPADYYTKAEADAKFLQAVDETAQNNAIAAKIPLTQKGQPNGVAPLDADGKVPAAMIPANGTFIPTTARGAAGGVAGLDSGGKVPPSQLPVGTPNGVAGLDPTGKVPLAQLPASLSGAYIPTSQKGEANGVAPLGADGKVPAANLPATIGGPFVPVGAVGAAGGVVPLGSDGKVSSAYLPGGGLGLAANEGIIRVISHDDPEPDFVTYPELRNYIWVRRGTALFTSPPLPDVWYVFNVGDGGGIMKLQRITEPTAIPLPLIDILLTGGKVDVAVWPAPGSSAQCVTRLSVNGPDPGITDTPSPEFPAHIVYEPTAGIPWSDGSGAHYRFVVKGRAFAPGLSQTAVATKTISVNADGSFYADY